METDNKKKVTEKKENDILFSKAVKAGKRIYYLDVKQSRNQDLYLAITESKKKVLNPESDAQVLFEKHKIFLYKEDFDKFTEGLQEVIAFIKQELPNAGKPSENSPRPTEEEHEDESKLKGFLNKFKF